MALTRTAKGTATNKSSSTGSLSVTGVALGAGSLIEVCVVGDGTAATATPAPSSVTWGSLTLSQAVAVTTADLFVGIYYGVATGAATNDVTATWGGTLGINKMIAVSEVSGWSAAPVL